MDLYNFIVAFQTRVLHPPPIPASSSSEIQGRLDAVVNRLISDRRAEQSAHRESSARGEPDKATSSPALSSRDEEDAQHAGMSDEQVRDEVLTILPRRLRDRSQRPRLDLYLVSQNPEVEASSRRLDAVIGTGSQQRLPTWPTTPPSAIPSRSSQNPCASTARLGHGRMSTSPSPSTPTASHPSHFFFSHTS